MRVAAVDIGTNTVRLLVADRTDEGLKEVERRIEVVGLGAGVDATGRLAADAIERTLDALRDFAAVVDLHGVSRLRAVATSATRDAANAPDFLDQATLALGARPEVISGEAEAALSFAGALMGLTAGPSTVVIDVGGGSTEFVFGTETVEFATSVDMGSVRLGDRLLPDRPARPDQIEAAREHVRGLFAELALPDADRVVGVAGTFTSLAGIELGQPTYDRTKVDGSELSQDTLDSLVERLAPLGLEETRLLPSLHPKRAPVILSGAVVAAEALRAVGHDRLSVSESDLLDGIAASI